MVWGAFSASEKADLVVIEGKQKSGQYISVLEKLIQSCWGILSRRVYKNEHQFEDRETLKSYIKQNWNEIIFETLRKLKENFLFG